MATRRRTRRRDKSTSEQVKDCCRAVTAFVFSNVGIIALFLGYAIVGAIVFQKIEGEDKLTPNNRVIGLRHATVQELWDITRALNVMFEGNWTELVDEKILQFQNSIVAAVGDGYDGRPEVTTQWSFSGGFLYSLTVMTTIGYGNIAPRTSMGKIVTIFYTCVGFPLFLLYLSNIGSVLAQSFKWIYAKLCKCQPARLEMVVEPELADEEAARPERWPDELGSERSQPEDSSEAERSTSAASGADSLLDLSTVTVPISMCLIIMAVYICGGAMFFARLEGWDFLTSCYFCFISLSTIGFGDYVPGDSIRSDSGRVEAGFVLTSMYLMLGMAIIAMCFNLMQEEVIQKVRSCAKCLGCLREDG
ncbi:TWiK family of potassium channels protein 7-like [Pollicipes pollicipes]|uniref:TWiK family of potassium channels protein 7-like n=1 Tax=Pollicipes pollicipes TaxID=41117 RepID=UPI00188497CD|nr:TWiK family of potassium channels protein 7-like [Pollicipes pollicipes]